MSIPMESLVAGRTSAGDVPAPSTALELDLPRVASAFGQRLHDADVPVSPGQTVQYVHAPGLTAPRSRRHLYVTTRAIFLTDLDQLATFNSIFAPAAGQRLQQPDSASSSSSTTLATTSVAASSPTATRCARRWRRSARSSWSLPTQARDPGGCLGTNFRASSSIPGSVATAGPRRSTGPSCEACPGGA